jgi:hypothetical protein
MAPRKRTNAYRAEYVLVHYGINPRTKSVDSVWESRDGTLSKGMPDGSSHQHQVVGNRRASDEIVIIWGLTDLFSVPAAMVSDETTKKLVEELRSKAQSAS